MVTANLRPRMKGSDTVEYNTSSILLQHNAEVEDLLKRLPGLRIDPDGSIYYNGDKIQHLYVDGEDIFGNDPTVVTRNFDATKIARVQIINSKSDQAVFTGFDDGARTKTINLIMKDSAKNGYFGKVDGGGDTENYYDTHGFLAGFRQKEQVMLLGIAANTGKQAFSDNGGASLLGLGGSQDPLDASAGAGIPRTDGIATHFSNTWPAPAIHLSANYQYSNYYTKPLSEIQTVQTQPDSIYSQNQSSQSINRQYVHWIYGAFDWTPNKRSTINILFHVGNSAGSNQLSSSTTSNFNEIQVNNTQRAIRDQVSRLSTGVDFSGRKQLGNRAGGNVWINVGINEIKKITAGYVYSRNTFYQPTGFLESLDTVDQRQQINYANLNIGATIGYNQPLWKNNLIGFSYGWQFTQIDALQYTYNWGNGKYQSLVDSLSTHDKNGISTQNIATNLSGKFGPLNYLLAVTWSVCDFKQNDIKVDSTSKISYTALAPVISLTYNPNSTASWAFFYTASSRQPSPDQLITVKNNSNPLNLTLGNPNLKPEFDQKLKLNFHRFKSWILNFRLDMTLTQNTIGSRTTTDSLGRQVTQPENTAGGKTISTNLSFDHSLTAFDLGLHTAGTYNDASNYLNTDFNLSRNYSGTEGISLRRFVKNAYSIQLDAEYTYIQQLNSVNAASPVRYWSHGERGDIRLYWLPNSEIGTNAVHTWQQKASTFDKNVSILMWNAYITRNFFHDNLVVKFQFNNITDANSGISRSSTGNVNTQAYNNILRRNWMLSLIYRFDKQFKKKS